MGFGGGGGSSSIAGSSDVALNSLANTQVLTYDSPSSKWKNAAVPTVANAQVTVRWSGSAWPARPIGSAFGVLFLSTNDASAPAPADVNLLAGDVWRRHPDAV
jgi:hypothetical protein